MSKKRLSVIAGYDDKVSRKTIKGMIKRLKPLKSFDFMGILSILVSVVGFSYFFAHFIVYASR